MTQCREGWHLDTEPVPHPAVTPAQKQLLATRAELHAAYLSARHDDDHDECAAIRETVAVVDEQLRRMGVHGRLAPLDGERLVRKRSTRRRQDAPNLPRRPVEHRTLGRVYGGRYPASERPNAALGVMFDSMFRFGEETFTDARRRGFGASAAGN